MDKNIDLKDHSSNDEENLTLSQIFSIITRRSKLFGIVTLFFFSGSVLFTIYQRMLNPIFRGTFIIMIGLNRKSASSYCENALNCRHF